MLYGVNNIAKIFDQQIYLNNSNDFDYLFLFPNFVWKGNYKNKMKKNYISNDVISKKLKMHYPFI